jgi:DMSO/TMAO reductase YedYZ molybdopterin-dependent catalytic subunit
MKISRRNAILTGTTIASVIASHPERALAQGASKGTPQPFPETLVEAALRPGFPVELPLLADGSAPEHNKNEAGAIDGPLMWRTPDRKTPASVVADYKQMAVRVETRGLGKLRGTMHFSDLEKLPQVTHTYLLQCGAAKPRGVVTWTGVRFNDFANMLGLVPGVHYCRFTAADGAYVDEDMTTLRKPQVLLAWMMNGEPVTADHGAPLRLIVPFRYGNRSIKAITDMLFATPGLPPPA